MQMIRSVMHAPSLEVTANQLSEANGRYYLRGTKGPALFAIVSDYCGHCSNLKRNVAQAQQSGQLTFCFLNADSDNEEVRKLLRSMNVTGFPEMYLVDENGGLVRYNGGRDPSTLLRHFGGAGTQGIGAKSIVAVGCAPIKVVSLFILVALAFMLVRRLTFP